ncbi:DUF2635 domain-containing protein [Nitratidesulfovibrio vulgaris]|jgi:hypothetical protein|uniref:DUF2635 domain-containing protein n=1 Tax=Nitratidesulfovibrio vulgaris (strain ATCC 29579 / DSM 644 / CCUG 34227 / NCIMB 8303 / VKM B-1760 / Hildenborough) TaxID=882 RepID=Q727J5_NITV2|nr:DUF2635 domain-containing protein [Nitratidesulfovibrio vulgaris]AAS94693.1 conserved hypothetical protein [Nitratidesulfovibrio vulgaris str. Hildenborough]AAS97332.1 conserved hypothetical protein [Nitratidesulfovibrio vulgaris str. Hildenborough]ADP87783.1 hypothetical protein Deval_2641 [Nitratidesulfovibrio vulgaris RCH1]
MPHIPETLHIRPRTGLVVRDPATMQPLPAEGAEVPTDSHWLRRLQAGDVVPVTAGPSKPRKGD